MKRLAALALLVLVAALPRGAHADNSAQIQGESARSLEGGGGRFVYLWWLPLEYWEACGRELGLTPEEQAKIAPLFRDYIIVAAIDATISPEKKEAQLKPIAEIVSRAKFYRNGEEVEVLREVGQELPEVAHRLVYLMRTSLPGIGNGLRLLPLANVDAKGNPILTGAGRGQLRIDYRFEASSPPQSVFWHAPFTAIAGAKTCPKGGETLEASFEFCPWHGVKVGGAR